MCLCPMNVAAFRKPLFSAFHCPCLFVSIVTEWTSAACRSCQNPGFDPHNYGNNTTETPVVTVLPGPWGTVTETLPAAVIDRTHPDENDERHSIEGHFNSLQKLEIETDEAGLLFSTVWRKTSRSGLLECLGLKLGKVGLELSEAVRDGQ